MLFPATSGYINKLGKLHIAIVLSSLVLVLPLTISGQIPVEFGSEGWEVGFNAERALRHVFVLASDSLRGRYSGFEGADKADSYIENHFRKLGLEEPFGEDGYFHNFTYGAGEYRLPSSFRATFLNGTVKDAYMWEEYNIYKYSGFGKVAGRMVFLGYGISAPEKGWDEYSGIDVTGAVVLVMRGVPDVKGIEWDRERSSGYKSTTALELGAVGFLMTDDNPPKLATITEKYYRENLPAMWISRSLADSLLYSTGKKIEDFKGILSDNQHPVSKELDVSIEMEVSGAYYPERPTRNIAALLPGCDEILGSEVVVIGAHMDHHGVDAAGNIYPGADDNASGTAAVMELAELFCNIRHSFKRSILFMGFAAEEEGLVGSKRFVESLPLGDYTIVSMLNMDMIGQGNGTVGIAGIPESPILGDILFGDHPAEAWCDSTMEKLAFWRLYPGSDHASFYKAGIPSYAIGARGSHPNYHTPLDTAGAVKPEIIKVVGEMTFHCASALADYPYPLAEYATKEQAVLRSCAGTTFETIMNGNDQPVWRTMWVDFPDPIKFISFPDIPEWDTASRLQRALTALERTRKHLQNEHVPILADSIRAGYSGEPFRGATLVLPSINYVTDDHEALQSLGRLGTSFVDVTGITYWMGVRLSNRNLDRHMSEPARLCRQAGIRPFVWDSDPEEVVRIADRWGKQLLYCTRISDINSENVEALAEAGCFILVKSSENPELASLLKELHFSECGDRIGIINDGSTAQMIANLMELGIDEDEICRLLVKNLQNALSDWWSDENYRIVESTSRTETKTSNRKKWWLN